ncbi:biotin carboxylase N-terminal domain-containing protein [Nocardioides speluncae]|uniref:ATP-binding protein n=1 Tax=Nocardioides speluncae TaxID=2670337 RepID=UPI000D69EBD6|nr:biotin carboxylase N-terminal domain-containing protein [Nocardioides speluncae]
MITRLLVANRGEIARRVFRTCRDLGISTVAIHSDADAGMPFVGEADLAIRLPGNTPAETYLRGELVIEAAQRAGADAIHPGYGFLSENADFARGVIDAGLTWVGPDPESMEKMATKVEAKALMAAAGVPVLTELAPADVTEADLPILVKASSGGGGRGMRVVRTLAEVAGAVELASAEAASAFGDPTVFCEPYVENGRHVEVQLVGDRDGNVEVFGERDCSVQRRHQKVIEETPAPGLSEETRAALHEAARQAGKAISYVGAGTVEFLLSGDRFFFLEMNTRLQVEHPVTELVTGTDLVALQLAAAEGTPVAPLGFETVAERPPQPAGRGHAVEVRLYAEDPAAGYQPQSGRLRRFEVPGVRAEFENPSSYGIRLDSGVRAGDEIGTFYDAMIAKVIAWAPTREQALRQLAGALERAEIHGLRTNRDLLVSLLRDPVVVAGDMHTTYLDGLEALGGGPDADTVALGGFAAAVALAERARLASLHHSRIPAGWRNVVSQPQLTTFVTDDDTELEVRWYGGRQFRSADLDGVVVERVEHGDETTTVTLGGDGVSRWFVVHVDYEAIDVESPLGHVALTKLPRFVDPADAVASGSLLAPMPGSVVTVAVAPGDRVEAGQQVLVLEAMKMQHSVTAPHNGVVTEIDVKPGDQVSAGAVLAVVSQDETVEEQG